MNVPDQLRNFVRCDRVVPDVGCHDLCGKHQDAWLYLCIQQLDISLTYSNDSQCWYINLELQIYTSLSKAELSKNHESFVLNNEEP